MNYSVSIEKTFSSAHALRGYRGKCERLHGHNWKVRATVSGRRLNKTGMLLDFNDLKALLGEILEPLDHLNLNEVPPFNTSNPSAENIAGYIYVKLKKAIKNFDAHLAVEEVIVWESDSSSARVGR